ncbi:MAG TPA: IPT/TIG domain-containing protein [Nitrospira sp.]|nr:IPT/TIG domain-containing protein [Nitrospira sp.]
MRVLISLLGSLFLSWATVSQGEAASPSLQVQPSTGVPGSTVTIVGKGLGQFKSTQFNRVTFGGYAALIQRWDPEAIEVRVPSKAPSGPVEVIVGKKRISAGTFTLVYPKITSIQPSEIEPGHSVELIGEHFGFTAGPRDPNTMFGVNDVVVAGLVVRPRRWKDDRIEVEIPANATSGDVAVRLSSSDPLPDGSCCTPVQHTISNRVPLTLIPSVRVDPLSGPIGTKVVLFGQGFGTSKSADDRVSFGGHQATVAQWTDKMIVVHVPMDAETGPVVLKAAGRERTVGSFTVHVPKVTEVIPVTAPIGTLVKIKGQHFGFYSESGDTPYAFTDFNTGQNRVTLGGVEAVIYRWQDDRIDVWVPFSAKSGPIVIYRGATRPKEDGSCCAAKDVMAIQGGTFTLTTPVIESYSPKTAGLDDLVTIKGSGFGAFLKTAEHAYLGINQQAYKSKSDVELNENVSRTEVLFSGIAAQVVSWTDTEIVVRVPHRNLYGVGKKGEFFDDLSTGPLVVRRGSWDVLPDGTCCTPKKWLTLEAGTFTIEAKGLPDPSYYETNRPAADTTQ